MDDQCQGGSLSLEEGGLEGGDSTSPRDGLLVFDLHGNVRDVNSAYVERTGVEREALLGKPLAELDVDHSRDQLAAHFTAAASRGVHRFQARHRCRSGVPWDVELSLICRTCDGRSEVLGVLRDLTRQRREELLHQLRLELVTVAVHGTLDDLLQRTLDEAERLTGSTLGSFHFVDADPLALRLQTWSTRTLEEMRKAEERGMPYSLSMAGAWADVRRLRRPIVHNDLATSPEHQGTPEGHATVVRELVVPVLEGERLVAVLGVGNKPVDYDSCDVDAVTTLAQLALDVIARKRAEAERRASDERFRALFESFPQGVICQDLHGAVLSANPAALILLRATAEQMRNDGLLRPPWELQREDGTPLPPDELPATIARSLRAPCRGILGLSRDAGPVTWVSMSSFPRLERDTTDPQEYFTILEDVTQLRQAQQAALDAQDRYRTIADAFEGFVYVTSSERRLLYMNPRMVERIGRNCTGEHCFAALHDRDTPCPGCVLPRVLQGERVAWEGQSSKDGRWYHIANFPILQTDGSVCKQTTMNDITERKREEGEKLDLERRLQKLAKLESLGVLAGGVAHDFNNILTAVLGHADMALGEVGASSPIREDLVEIERSARRAAELCQQMLAYSGKGRFVIRPLNLADFLRSQWSGLRSTVSTKLDLRLQLPTRCSSIDGDADQLRQLLSHLLTNAAEATSAHEDHVIVEVGERNYSRSELSSAVIGEELPEGDYVYLEVRDTGCGMDAATIARIFDPFFSTKFAGRGLGMPAVLGIVRSHRGAIFLDSLQGRGTTVRVLFPLARALRLEQGAAVVPSRRGAEPARKRVLFIDDEEPIRIVGHRALKRAGYEVLIAKDGAEALELYQRTTAPIALVVLDMTMPRMDGLSTLHALRAIAPEQPVIMMSGYAADDFTNQLGELPLQGFLQKPFSPGELVGAVQHLLEIKTEDRVAPPLP